MAAQPVLPKTYTLERFGMYVAVGVAAIYALLCLVVIIPIRMNNPPGTVRDVATGFMITLALLPFPFIWFSANSRTELHADRIEKRTPFGAYRVFAHELAGFRDAALKGYIRLISKDANAKPFSVKDTVLFDGTGLPWIDALRNLDAADRNAQHQAIESHPRLGATPRERAAFIATVRPVVKWLNRAGWAIGIWGYVWPYPYRLVIGLLVLAPLAGLALMVWARPLVQIDEFRDEPKRTSVIGLIFLPSAVLALRALRDIGQLDWEVPLLLAACIGMALAAVTVWCDPTVRRRHFTIVSVALVFLAYAAGALLIANCLLDTDPARHIATVVNDKHKSSGKVTTYDLTVGPWGDERADNDVAVSKELYDAVKPGDPICIYLNGGAFGWRWYWIDHCPPDVPPPNPTA